jgi:hypothetical protein
MFIPIQSNDRFGFKDNQGLFSFHDFEDDWKSVCIGYSQGGSVALATHRFIEENGLADELHFAGSVCGDGPYDPVAHLGYYMNDDGETYNGSSQHSSPVCGLGRVPNFIDSTRPS